MMPCSPLMPVCCFAACSTIWAVTSTKPSAPITAASRLPIRPMPPASRPSPNTPAASSNTPPLWTIPQLTRRLLLLLHPSRLSCKSHPQRRPLFRRPRPPSKNSPGAAPTTKSSTCFHGSSFKRFTHAGLRNFLRSIGDSNRLCVLQSTRKLPTVAASKGAVSTLGKAYTGVLSFPGKQLLPCPQQGSSEIFTPGHHHK